MIHLTTATTDQLLEAAALDLRAGRKSDAEQKYRTVIAQNPASAVALRGLGMMLARTQHRSEAVALLERAIQIEPDSLSFLYLSSMLYEGGHPQPAIDLLRHGTTLFPENARIQAELARALQLQGLSAEAEVRFEQAHAKWPDEPVLAYYFGSFLFEIGNVTRAEQVYRSALYRHPTDPRLHSALLFILHFVPGMTAQRLLAEHKEWNRIHAEPLAREIQPFANDRDPERRLRIGYVSPEFRGHPVGRFMEPILAGHNRQQFLVVAYSDVAIPDDFTRRMERSADLWRPVLGMSDTHLAELIRADKIDILIDLSMHLARNRLLTFARKPAPVQSTYLAYCGTTGLATMDYRLSDPVFDPAGWDDRYTERTVRLPGSWWHYGAPAEAPDVIGRQGGGVVFGCLNTLAKVSDEALRLWAQILQRVLGSKVLLHAPNGSARERILNVFKADGIVGDRVLFSERMSMENYFAAHRQMDIALDPFPYAGGTTTCDALWMGVPVVTLAGDMAIGRGSASVLTSIKMPELIAANREEYADIAVRLAEDGPRQADLRRTLRDRMRASLLMDAPGFLAGLESTYRTLWRQWCANPTGAA